MPERAADGGHFRASHADASGLPRPVAVAARRRRQGTRERAARSRRPWSGPARGSSWPVPLRPVYPPTAARPTTCIRD